MRSRSIVKTRGAKSSKRRRRPRESSRGPAAIHRDGIPDGHSEISARRHLHLPSAPRWRAPLRRPLRRRGPVPGAVVVDPPAAAAAVAEAADGNRDRLRQISCHAVHVFADAGPGPPHRAAIGLFGHRFRRRAVTAAQWWPRSSSGPDRRRRAAPGIGRAPALSL